jgi:hypothetical protein
MRIGGSSDRMSVFGVQQRPTVRPILTPASAAEATTTAPGPVADPAAPTSSSLDPAAAALDDVAKANGFAGESEPSDGPPKPPGTQRLTPDQEAEVAQLRRRDAEVRAHEAAHAAAAGALGGGASFDFVTGPDGHSYAVGGEVPVQMSGGNTPEEAIRNAAQVRAAALAPAQPSAQDRAVAAEASAIEAAARAEIAARSASSGPAEPSTQPLGAADEATSRGGEQAMASADPAETIQKLEVEQRSSRGGWRHLHSTDGCGGCGVAIAAYR